MRRHISSAVVIVEYVEKPAVQNRVELFLELWQPEGIPDEEPCRQTAIAGFALRLIDRSDDGVDAGGIQSTLGSHERMLTGSASDIQHASAQHPTPSQLDEGWLWPPDVPRRRPGVIHRTEAVYLLRCAKPIVWGIHVAIFDPFRAADLEGASVSQA
jgi:hypothetical protein